MLEKMANKLAELECRVEHQNPPGLDFDRVGRTCGETVGAPEMALSISPPLRFLGRLFNPILNRRVLI
ncbi:MAG: hypothetical protein M2R45_03862 [Verrucomicrobia subdivision 3 bacterium]|nr:hypothetical protein [Limisphaerales bacterium]MCS1412566.1 hypothetical protein [Limisphaerales bacterium]